MAPRDPPSTCINVHAVLVKVTHKNHLTKCSLTKQCKLFYNLKQTIHTSMITCSAVYKKWQLPKFAWLTIKKKIGGEKNLLYS